MSDALKAVARDNVPALLTATTSNIFFIHRLRSLFLCNLWMKLFYGNNPNRHRNTRSRLVDREASHHTRVLSAYAQRADARVQPEKQPQSSHVIHRESGR